MNTSKAIVGTWNLETFEIENGVSAVESWGEDPPGLLIYSPDGHVSVSINRRIQLNRRTGSRLDDMLFYAGRYEIEANLIHHYVQNASDVNRIGTDLVRTFSVSEKRLELRGSAKSGKAFKLIWTR